MNNMVSAVQESQSGEEGVDGCGTPRESGQAVLGPPVRTGRDLGQTARPGLSPEACLLEEQREEESPRGRGALRGRGGNGSRLATAQQLREGGGQPSPTRDTFLPVGAMLACRCGSLGVRVG